VPASEPRKEQLAGAIVTALRGINTGADYWTDLGRNVSRRRYNVEEVDTLNLPCASVWTGDAEPSPNQVTGRYRERVQILVELWVRSDSKEALDRDTIRAEADVKQAVLTTLDLGLSGVVVEVSPSRVQADHQEFADQNRGRRVVAFEVDYQWTASTP
jgi:hypothetical protein